MNIRLKYNTKFNAGVFYRGRLTMTVFNLKLWLLTTTEDEEEQNIAFDRIRYFIDKVMQNTIFIDDDKIDVCRKLTAAGVSVTTLPSLPVDQIIGLVLHAKLNAITQGRLAVIDTEISSDFGDQVVYLHGEEEDPGVAEEPGWWQEPDLSHYDGEVVTRTGKVVDLSKIKKWREVGLSWPDECDNIVFEPSSNTVIFGDFGGDTK